MTESPSSPEPTPEPTPEPDRVPFPRTMDADAMAFLVMVTAVAMGFYLVMFVPIAMEVPIGAAITFGVPLALGTLGGLLARRASTLIMLGVVMFGICAVVGVLLANDLAGVFCGCIYFVVAIPPAVFSGALVLWLRRRAAEAGRPRRPGALWFLAVLVPTLAGHGFDRLQGPHAEESLEFSRDIDASAAQVWAQSLVFAQAAAWPFEAMHAPLPRVGSGNATAVGDEKIVRFDKGVIRLRVVAVEPGRRLVAEVLEQGVERRALLLHRVVVTCEPLGTGRTRATVRIEFEPRMGPRWYWRLFEGCFGGITFDAVLSAWQSGVEAQAHRAEPGR